MQEQDKCKCISLFLNIFRFRAASGNAITGDIGFLSIGYFLIIGYLAIMLGKFTRLEHKVS